MIQVTRFLCSYVRKPSIRSLSSSPVSIYTFGDAWTGALGNGSVTGSIPGHEDDEITTVASTPPVFTGGEISGASAGWGHTAVIMSSSSGNNSKRELYLTGRPHDFDALLQLHRMPAFLRDFTVRQTLANSQGIEESAVRNPAQLLGYTIAKLADTFAPNQGGSNQEQPSMFDAFTPLDWPYDNDNPVDVVCSAGFSVVRTEKGHLYSFGRNGFGQCGVGEKANAQVNVWTPCRVTGLHNVVASDDDDDAVMSSHSVDNNHVQQSHPVTQVALGLQHGICLNSAGQVFCWGKGERGQLGRREVAQSASAVLVDQALLALETNNRPTYFDMPPIQAVAAGMLHNAALTKDGRVLLWGKNVLAAYGDDEGKQLASDSFIPCTLHGLPDCPVQDISCGSHHTSILMKDGSIWAVGVASDERSILHDPVCLVPAGVVELPVRFFAAHMDRTTVVGRTGQQVLQVHLWKDQELREHAIFTPSWLEGILQQNEYARIRHVLRGWKHTVVVTD